MSNLKRQQLIAQHDHDRSISTSHTHLQRPPSPNHVPKTNHPESDVYILTLLTDKKHHDQLTHLRTKYFPKHLNHLEAHITFFHALPASKLDKIISDLEAATLKSREFRVLATTPFKLNKGIAIGLPKSAGGDESRHVHSMLRDTWQGFLSEQDAGGFKPHYTIMNKVDDRKAIDQAYEELQKDFKAVRGVAEGLTLWKYNAPRWDFFQDFKFRS